LTQNHVSTTESTGDPAIGAIHDATPESKSVTG
jgi:hypothetical protein